MKAGPRIWLTQPSHEIQLPCSFVPSLEGLGCRKRDKALATRQFLQDSASLGMSMSQKKSCSHCTNVISALEQLNCPGISGEVVREAFRVHRARPDVTA